MPSLSLSLSLSAFFVFCRHSQKNASPLFCSLFIFPRFAAALNASSGPYPVSPGGVLSVLCSCACASVFEEPRSEGRRETLSFDGCIDRGASFFAAAAMLQLSVAARSPAARRRSPCFGGGTGAGGSRAPGSNVMHISCRGATKMRNRKREKSLNFQTRPSNRKLHWRRRPCSIPSLSLSRARPPARRSLSCFPFSTRQTQHINSSLKTEEEAPEEPSPASSARSQGPRAAATPMSLRLPLRLQWARPSRQTARSPRARPRRSPAPTPSSPPPTPGSSSAEGPSRRRVTRPRETRCPCRRR